MITHQTQQYDKLSVISTVCKGIATELLSSTRAYIFNTCPLTFGISEHTYPIVGLTEVYKT